MRVQTEEWRRFIPGVRMYKGKMTLFYNGEKLWEDDENDEWLIYDSKERWTWEVIIVLPGVEIIPACSFCDCRNVKVVIMADAVRRVERGAFIWCTSLKFIRLSINLEFIGHTAFYGSHSLTSIFIPPSCRVIDYSAFKHCKKLITFKVPYHTQIGANVIADTALIKASPFETDIGYSNTHEVNEWIRNRHVDNHFSLHRACSASNPLEEVIFDLVQRQGIGAFNKPDSVGVTPSQYLSENPFTDITEQMLMRRYILDLAGEVV